MNGQVVQPSFCNCNDDFSLSHAPSCVSVSVVRLKIETDSLSETMSPSS